MDTSPRSRSSENFSGPFCHWPESKVMTAMEIPTLLKAGFAGFAICVGTQMLVFYFAGSFLTVSYIYFSRVFVLACIFSFLLADLFLYQKIQVSHIPNSQVFLVGCIGGWLSGIFFGLTQLKRLLRKFLK